MFLFAIKFMVLYLWKTPTSGYTTILIAKCTLGSKKFMISIRVLYDGWPLITQPNSPSALHLRAILAQLPEQVEALVALPDELSLGGDVATAIQPTPNSPCGRLRWEQLVLPRIRRRLEADLLHLTSPGVPLLAGAKNLVSPCGYSSSWSDVQHPQGEGQHKSFWERLRLAAAAGGLARLEATLWPDDLPAPTQAGQVHALPPSVHPDFIPGKSDHQAGDHTAALELPDTYLLYHGPGDPDSLYRLILAWRWAAAHIGTYHPLLVTGLKSTAQAYLQALLEQSNFGDTVQITSATTAEMLVPLYQGCTALFHPAPVSPWGGAVRRALACGKPVVAAEGALASALVGPAAYLAPMDDPRALGAALITVVVEEEVAGDLAKAAGERAGGWEMQGFGARLVEVYEAIVDRG